MRGFSCARARARDDVTSMTGSGSAAAWKQGTVAFAATHWSLVLEAQGESPAAQEALEKLCRIYWRPIYSFLRRQVSNRKRPRNLTQCFFAVVDGASLWIVLRAQTRQYDGQSTSTWPS